ncbi:MAG: NUDIX hydrolase [Candidatus Thorarchaeota archaeon]|jgi:8-oxo-dGTP pyrophosphatase MutT (NUDIX family)
MKKNHMRNVTYDSIFGIYFRSAGVMQNGNRVLLSRVEEDDIWVLPGGGVKLYETTEEALEREILEEMGFEIQVERLLWIVENIFDFKASNLTPEFPPGKYHDIHYTYLIKPKEEDGDWLKEEFYGLEDDFIPGKKWTLVFRWFALDELDEINLVPVCMKQILKKIPDHPTVVVNREE